MQSSSGRYLIVFNGEVYNFRLLQNELIRLGHTFRGHSDTEVMLAAFEQWGLQATLPKLWGMFAFALWDERRKTLSLVRDRFGVKPLYYGNIGGSLFFASELSPFSRIPGFSRKLNRAVLPLYLRYGNVPSPHCIWQGLNKLPPGTLLTIDTTKSITPTPVSYWQLSNAVDAGLHATVRPSYREAVDETDRLLRDSIKLRMISDVPLGVFLSGGVDSSLVTALMQTQSGSPVCSYTIGYKDQTYDESFHAEAIARHLGTNHTTLVAEENHVLEVIPRLARIYDEPFADSSQIPTFLVAQMARQHVTVALTGDGGDESFGGYNRHISAPAIWQKVRGVPRPARLGLAWLMNRNLWEEALLGLNHILPTKSKVTDPLDKFRKLALAMKGENPGDIHLLLSSIWQDPQEGLADPEIPPLWNQFNYPGNLNFAEQMMYRDTLDYMPNDILVKVDRASMAVALELREPLLDHRLVEFAWQLPLGYKIHDGRGKRILRDVVYRYVPAALIDRPKTGFGIPINRWLRGTLRDWADELLSVQKLNRAGIFNSHKIRLLWDEHQSNKRDNHHQLWTVLMFNLWMDEWCPL
jgi:asparagine synthase (glutamine-hydrolysing)